MPRAKRSQNPLKLAAQLRSDAHPPATDAPAHSSFSVQAPSQAPAHSLPADEVPQQASTQPSNSSLTPRCHNGRESTVGWSVETIDSKNAIKKIKIKVKEVSNLPSGERIIVDFDDHGSAYGEAQGLLAGYCGKLASNCNLFPIGFEKWSGELGMPKTYKEGCFETMIKPEFFFRTSESTAYRYCNASIAKKWATHRQRMWNEFYDPAQTKDEIINNVPMGIPRDQWAAFVNYRLKPSTMELCKKNKEIRNKQVTPHTCGSKSNSRRRHELMLETGEIPSRGRMYIETHKRKNGSFVNDEARAIVEQLELNMTKSNINKSEVSPDDAIGKVLGPEHSGRVRCMGMGAAPTNTFRNVKSRLSDLSLSSFNSAGSPSTSIHLQHKVTRLETQLQNTLNALKTYMIMKEGKIPEEFVGLFASQLEPNDVGREPASPLDDGRSSDGSNTNYEAEI